MEGWLGNIPGEGRDYLKDGVFVTIPALGVEGYLRRRECSGLGIDVPVLVELSEDGNERPVYCNFSLNGHDRTHCYECGLKDTEFNGKGS